MVATLGKIVVSFIVGCGTGWILCTFFNPKSSTTNTKS